MLVKHKNRLIDCYMNKDMVCFSVYADSFEDGPLEVLGQGGMFPGANITVAEQIRRIKQEIDSGDYVIKDN